MEDERSNKDVNKPSYWLDACEDISCDLIDDLVSDFDPSSVAVAESIVNNDFFGGIDHILDSIKNGGGLPNNEAPQLNPGDVTKENGLQRSGVKRDDKEEGDKNRKRARVCSYQSERSRGVESRKRTRSYEDTGGGHNKRRDGYNYYRRDGRGYWERDKVGSNQLVYRSGTWEADHERDVKKESRRKGDEKGEEEEKKGKPEEQRKEKVVEEQARRYQLDVLEQAKAKNTIAFLETGAGKTLIAILLIKSVHKDLMSQNRKMLSVFLVPKVPLVYQQAEVIRNQTCFQVGHYCGEMGQDFWDARRWQREFESKQVLVMTAQILLNILRHSIIRMESINLLILDECHHAVKKHPYSLVMSEFYHTTSKDKRPAIFGMTASPVNLKGTYSFFFYRFCQWIES